MSRGHRAGRAAHRQDWSAGLSAERPRRALRRAPHDTDAFPARGIWLDRLCGACRGRDAALARAAPVRRVDNGTVARIAEVRGVTAQATPVSPARDRAASSRRRRDKSDAAVLAGRYHVARARACHRARSVVEHAGGDAALTTDTAMPHAK